jgi:hypothetical protein
MTHPDNVVGFRPSSTTAAGTSVTRERRLSAWRSVLTLPSIEAPSPCHRERAPDRFQSIGMVFLVEPYGLVIET